jgi:hypothetical protein
MLENIIKDQQQIWKARSGKVPNDYVVYEAEAFDVLIAKAVQAGYEYGMDSAIEIVKTGSKAKLIETN